MKRPLFLPAVGPEYDAWWRAMDKRLARQAEIGRRIRRAARRRARRAA